MGGITADRISRGHRVKQIQTALNVDGKGFVALLQQQAAKLRIEMRWYDKRLSSIVTGVQDLSAEDLAVFTAIDPKERGWYWLAFGVEEPNWSTVRIKAPKTIPPRLFRPVPKPGREEDEA